MDEKVKTAEPRVLLTHGEDGKINAYAVEHAEK